MKLTIKTAGDLQAEAQEVARQAERSEALAYLADTDWMVVRYAETGKDIPADVLKKRQAARDVI